MPYSYIKRIFAGIADMSTYEEMELLLEQLTEDIQFLVVSSWVINMDNNSSRSEVDASVQTSFKDRDPLGNLPVINHSKDTPVS